MLLARQAARGARTGDRQQTPHAPGVRFSQSTPAFTGGFTGKKMVFRRGFRRVTHKAVEGMGKIQLGVRGSASSATQMPV